MKSLFSTFIIFICKIQTFMNLYTKAYYNIESFINFVIKQ